MLEQVSQPTPGEQLVADAWRMKRLSARLQARLLERSLESLGDSAFAVISREHPSGAHHRAALEKRESKTAGYHARRVLAPREGYDTADLLKALSHALAYGALEHLAIERILIAGAGWTSTSTVAHMLFTLLDRRHTNATTGITSHIIGDATLAAAVLDRLAANSIRIDIDGPSYRQHLAHQRAKEQGLELPAEDAA